ncbi:hypothetical protein B296_00009862 [Ensete ventricosum]|uniref:Uncharacterized protein n=1 Tax=Ensete ventricosum TaxID=4639 RepID=A0A427AK59_ENSVE|nr:hypothetical protein B296_00009862 [Ensete ventricosum]
MFLLPAGANKNYEALAASYSRFFSQSSKLILPVKPRRKAHNRWIKILDAKRYRISRFSLFFLLPRLILPDNER